MRMRRKAVGHQATAETEVQSPEVALPEVTEPNVKPEVDGELARASVEVSAGSFG